MEESVLLRTKPLVDSIRHSIRDPSGVFSVEYVTLLSVISFNDVTIPAFSTLLNELNASLPQCCLELWRWQAGLFY